MALATRFVLIEVDSQGSSGRAQYGAHVEEGVFNAAGSPLTVVIAVVFVTKYALGVSPL